MNKDKYAVCIGIIALLVGVVVGISILKGNAVLPVVAVMGGMSLIYLCRKRLANEDDVKIMKEVAKNASGVVLFIFGPALVILGAVFMALSNEGALDLYQAGEGLAYSACGLLGLYLVFYAYYAKKKKAELHEKDNEQE